MGWLMIYPLFGRERPGGPAGSNGSIGIHGPHPPVVAGLCPEFGDGDGGAGQIRPADGDRREIRCQRHFELVG